MQSKKHSKAEVLWIGISKGLLRVSEERRCFCAICRTTPKPTRHCHKLAARLMALHQNISNAPNFLFPLKIFGVPILKRLDISESFYIITIVNYQ